MPKKTKPNKSKKIKLDLNYAVFQEPFDTRMNVVRELLCYVSGAVEATSALCQSVIRYCSHLIEPEKVVAARAKHALYIARYGDSWTIYGGNNFRNMCYELQRSRALLPDDPRLNVLSAIYKPAAKQ